MLVNRTVNSYTVKVLRACLLFYFMINQKYFQKANFLHKGYKRLFKLRSIIFNKCYGQMTTSQVITKPIEQIIDNNFYCAIELYEF